MKTKRKLGILVFAAALAVIVSIGLSNAFGQSGCVMDCLSAYEQCVNDPVRNDCDFAYEICVDGCLGQ
jgi:hypothetical protein